MPRRTMTDLQQEIYERNQLIRAHEKTIEECRDRLREAERLAAQQHQMVFVRDQRIKELEADLKDEKIKVQLQAGLIHKLRKVLDAALEQDLENEVEWWVEE